MSVRAVADKKYIRKYLFLAAAGLGFFLWGVYDAIYKFPLDLAQAIAFEQIKEQVEDPNDAVEAWQQLAQQNKDRGWKLERPKNSSATVQGYQRFNAFIIFGGFGLMLFFLWKYFRTRGSWLESTETGVKTSWGSSLEFDQITKINKRRWEAKGIAKVTFTDAGGRNRTMVLDDFKYDREPMGELMALCESRLAPEQITGGRTQAEIAADQQTSGNGEPAATEPEKDDRREAR